MKCQGNRTPSFQLVSCVAKKKKKKRTVQEKKGHRNLVVWWFFDNYVVFWLKAEKYGKRQKNISLQFLPLAVFFFTFLSFFLICHSCAQCARQVHFSRLLFAEENKIPLSDKETAELNKLRSECMYMHNGWTLVYKTEICVHAINAVPYDWLATMS